MFQSIRAKPYPLWMSLVIICLGFHLPVEAAKKKHEVYSAIIDETDPLPPPSSKTQTHLTPISSKTTPIKSDLSYDQVPPEQIDSIAHRLKRVEQILRKSGRAYDYRVHTNQELELILSELDEHAPKEAKSDSSIGSEM